MAVPAIFKLLQDSPLGRTITESAWMFPTLESIHVVAIATVIGSIAVVDLRLLGVASKDRPVSLLTREFLPWTWAAFGLAAVTGSLLFSSRAADYMAISAFTTKFVIMALAGINMLVFHLTTQRSMAKWDIGRPALGAKLAGAISLALWAGIVICGRKVGFSL